MSLLILFAFFGGIVTILSPCILPILPIVLSGGITGGKKRPLGVVTGFILSFTFFTLFLTAIVKATGISADSLRGVSVFVVAALGASLLIPQLQTMMEKLFSRLANLVPIETNTNRPDFVAGLFIGLSLGLVWTPCVGPILASIITVAATSSIGFDAVAITLAYSIGTAIPLLAITYGGRSLLQSHPLLLTNSAKIQKAFGVLMIVTAIAIYFSWDRQFQAYILEKFPSYGIGLTKFEDNDVVKKELEKMKEQPKKALLRDMFTTNLGQAPELIPGGQWFNGNPVTISSLKGSVVLVDFWTYTCINCIRTLPYLKNWHTKYKDKGLVIIGVHTPEFEFEKDPKNVAKAIKDFGLTYLVMQDNDFDTWNAYNNRYWPAKYLIDKDGIIRYTHFGEGAYDETERVIQELLGETGSVVNESIDNPTYQVSSRTPETYLGYFRMSGFASPEGIKRDKQTLYSRPTTLSKNSFAFTGTWTIGGERSMPIKGATLEFHFDAKDVFLVMRPKTFGALSKVKVFLDGVEKEVITVNGDRLYELIKLPTPGSHILKLEFLDDNVELYAFTFG